jgi:tRNA (cytidine/uridine-2'-O-)-methyltransferase
MNVVLLEPEIPPNTGNVARLCSATRTRLHLVEPFGFKLDHSSLKRAGMDYWEHVEWSSWRNWAAFIEHLPPGSKLWFIESGGPSRYTDVTYAPDDFLVFGRETAGLPKDLLAERRQDWIRLPMFNRKARSLNLANCVAIVLYEALRQQGFPNET